MVSSKSQVLSLRLGLGIFGLSVHLRSTIDLVIHPFMSTGESCARFDALALYIRAGSRSVNWRLAVG